jgi:hypothetical protein
LVARVYEDIFGYFFGGFRFFRGFLGPVKFGFINSLSYLCYINPQILVKIFDYHDEFIILSSYEKRDGNPGNILESPYLVINNLMKKGKNNLPVFF